MPPKRLLDYLNTVPILPRGLYLGSRHLEILDLNTGPRV